MTPVTLTVNGERIETHVEPRTHLADFLREHCRITGTHLGCEHGVCGACTVLIDGQPARSCIAFAVQSDGQDVRTIEGFEDDLLMAQLRAAFTREHALQCGFCTPGMLIAARDIVERCPDADERRIRIELSGNLCRCTGYLGIVNAVRSVIESRRGMPALAAANAPIATPVAPPWQTFSATEASSAGTVARAPQLALQSEAALGARAPEVAGATAQAREGFQRIEASFVADHSIERVWAAFADVRAVASCLPGATVDEATDESAKGRIAVKFGPMSASFQGAAALERDDASRTGRLRGGGADSLTHSRAKADIVYRLAAEAAGAKTRVSIVMDYNLQGPLAQFSRSGIVKAFADRMVAQFGANLNERLGAAAGARAGEQAPPAAPAQLDAGSMFWQWLWARIKALLGK